jgi:hypothetical protein
VSSVGRETLQKLWVDDGGDVRRSSKLWEPYSEIRLVRVASDAQSAFFVRTPPPPKEGEPAKEPKEEEMFKTSLGLTQELLQVIHRMEGRRTAGPTAKPSQSPSNSWVDMEETSMIGKTVNIGRKDEQRFRDNPDDFLSQLNADTYVSKHSDLRGVQVRNIDPAMASRFGVQQSDVLIEVNGRPVQTKAQAIQAGKADYQRGVRSFQTKWWSNGQIVERTIQVPDR